MRAFIRVATKEKDTGQYGRIELRRTFHKNFVWGLVISIFIHLAVVGSYYVSVFLDEDENIPVVRVKLLKYSDLGPPPSISSVPLSPPVGIAAAVKPSVGLPVPVPDAEVSPEQTIATQQELSTTPSPALEEFDGDGNVQITQDIQINPEDEPGMDEFIPVEKAPQLVRQVVPEYPDMARRAGLEGVVWVKILVGKDGKPIKVAIAKSSTEILNNAALEAAMKFLFTPAVMNNGPVKVWVSVPFRFKLKDTPS